MCPRRTFAINLGLRVMMVKRSRFDEFNLSIFLTDYFHKQTLNNFKKLPNCFRKKNLRWLVFPLEQGWARFSHEGPDLKKLLKPRATR